MSIFLFVMVVVSIVLAVLTVKKTDEQLAPYPSWYRNEEIMDAAKKVYSHYMIRTFAIVGLTIILTAFAWKSILVIPCALFYVSVVSLILRCTEVNEDSMLLTVILTFWLGVISLIVTLVIVGYTTIAQLIVSFFIMAFALFAFA